MEDPVDGWRLNDRRKQVQEIIDGQAREDNQVGAKTEGKQEPEGYRNRKPTSEPRAIEEKVIGRAEGHYVEAYWSSAHAGRMTITL